jgi:hypothetical protein
MPTVNGALNKAGFEAIACQQRMERPTKRASRRSHATRALYLYTI